MQCNVALAITEAFKSCDKLYQELRLEYLHQRRWMRKVCLLYKFPSTEQPSHCSTNSLQLSKHLIFIFTSSAFEKFAETLQHFHRIFLNTSKILFFSYVIHEWNKLNPNICSSISYKIFCNALLELIRSVCNEKYWQDWD